MKNFRTGTKLHLCPNIKNITIHGSVALKAKKNKINLEKLPIFNYKNEST